MENSFKTKLSCLSDGSFIFGFKEKKDLASMIKQQGYDLPKILKYIDKSNFVGSLNLDTLDFSNGFLLPTRDDLGFYLYKVSFTIDNNSGFSLVLDKNEDLALETLKNYFKEDFRFDEINSLNNIDKLGGIKSLNRGLVKIFYR